MASPYSLTQFKAVLHGLGYHLEPEELNGKRNNRLNLRTQAAIREFQTYYQLPITGEPDLPTQEKARQLIRNLQHSLNLTINAQLPISEFYGNRTTRAVQRFQQEQGLTATGIATPQVRQVMENAVKQQLRQRMEIMAGRGRVLSAEF